MTPKLTRARGFTLLELCIVLAIFTIVLAIGIPSLRRWQDSQNVSASAKQLEGFLAEVRQGARKMATTVHLHPVGGASFEDCAEIHAHALGTGESQTRVFLPTGGVRLGSGPAARTLVISPSGGFDVRGAGYLAVQGSHPDHRAFVTFNAAGYIGSSATQPASQAIADEDSSDSACLTYVDAPANTTVKYDGAGTAGRPPK